MTIAGATLAALGATGAHAAIIETVAVSNQYGYGFSGDGGNLKFTADGGGSGSFRVPNGPDDTTAEVGLDFTGTQTSGNFFFLANGYCVGTCMTFALTTVTVTVENTGDNAELLRFDSQITAGHLATAGLLSSSAASFNFGVSQTTDTAFIQLYSANGLANRNGVSITTSNGVDFNGLTSSINNTPGSQWDVLDWSATNLNLNLLPIVAHSTSVITYTSLTQTSTGSSSCADLVSCVGVQVAFGDPRNNGSVTSTSVLAPLDSTFQLNGDPQALTPVIGRQFYAAKSYLDVVAAGAPLPDDPALLPPVTYGAPFVPGSVPEPASWAMMIAGFGLTGGAMRRRRTVLTAAI